MPRKTLAIAVMLTVVSGCDNVEWGGSTVALKGPPPRAEMVAEAPGLAAALAEDAPPVIELPTGPLLLAGTRSGTTATLTVVGEVQGDAIGPFPSEEDVPGYRELFTTELLPIGSEWVLFSRGVRVGRMTVAETGLTDGYCTVRPTVSGPVELTPNAASIGRLMALPIEHATARNFGTNAALQHDYDQRVASLNLAATAIQRVGAAFPPDGALSIRQDIQVFRFPGEDNPRIAATFVHQDRIDTSEPAAGAYSIFVLGDFAGGTSYRPGYVGYRPSDDEGKGVPRYFDHLDWDGDGRTEILLDVFGTEGRWFTSLGERSGSWVTTSLDSCGAVAGN